MQKQIYAYIDGQNLHLGTLSSIYAWKINPKRFYIYLKDKYKVKRAYYYFGVRQSQYEHLYKQFRKAGFILKFRLHNAKQKSFKKGNVDVDIVFDVMRIFCEKPNINFILVTQDGDYIRLVLHLVHYKRLKKVLFPNLKTASSLYKHFLRKKYWSDLSNISLLRKLI